jgi:HK97 family phage major capsid protein
MPDSKQLPKEIQRGAVGAREIQITRSAVNIDTRTVDLAFSSETPVPRWWGVEILDHNPKSVRLDRMKRGGPLLMDHDPTDQVGVVESIEINGKDKVGRAVVRFGRGARASEILQDVADGIRSLTSVRYSIHEAVLESEKDGVDTYRITDWEPFEITLTSIPADTAVGVGRSAAPTTETPAPEPAPEATRTQERTTMPEAITPAAPAAATEEQLRAARETAQRSGTDDERTRVASILAISNQFARYGLGELAVAAIKDGSPIDAFRAKAMDVVASKPTPTAEIGLSEREAQRYSFIRMLAHLANPTDKRARESAAFEIECSSAAGERSGKKAQGIIVPFDVLKRTLPTGEGQRDLTVGGSAGNLVATDLLSNSFIDILRNAMVIDRLGAQMLTGLVGNIAIPRQTGGAVAYWLAESGAPTESAATFDQVGMSPKTVGAFSDISRKLLQQSSIDVENFVQGDIAKALGLGIQAAAIVGGGSNEPTGILSTSGIGNVAGGTNGLAPTWANIVDLETAVAVANADVGTLGYLTNAKVRGTLKKTQKFASTNGDPIWADGTEPLNGYQAGVTNAVPSNLDKGTAVGVCSAILYGNFADLIIAMWGGLDILVDPYSNSTSGTVRIVAMQDVDVAVRHALSFAAMKDALTP